jgi:putative membrane protein
VKDQVKYSLAGFCMGVAELIPGISGSTVAVIFKIYPNLMTILSQLRLKNISLNFSLISQTFQFRVSMPLVFSMLAAILLCSNLISFLMNNYEQLLLHLLGWLMMFLSIYVANFFKASLKRFNLLVFLFLGILMGYFLQELNINSGAVTPLYLFFSGVIAFSFFLIPGISGSAILVVLGAYSPVIQATANLNFLFLFPFALGCLTSLLILPKLVMSLYVKYEQRLMYIFSGLIFSSGYFLL